MTVYSGDAQKIVAMADDGSFVSIDLNPSIGLAVLKSCNAPGPILSKTITKKNADYRAAVELHATMLKRVPVFELEGPYG